MAAIDDKKANAVADQTNRNPVIESVVIRLMKARKQMSFNDLVTEVTKQISIFEPGPRDIKNRIESLIEREYLERDEINTTMFKYLA